LAGAAAAQATTIHADWSEWQGGVTGVQTTDFEGLTGTYASYGTATGLIDGEAQFLGITHQGTYWLYVVNGNANSDHNYGTGTVLKGPTFNAAPPSRLRINLPAAATAVAFELGVYGSSSAQYTVSLANGEQWTGIAAGARPALTFFGVTADTPFSQLDIIMTSGMATLSHTILDNFAYGTTSPLPPSGPEAPETAPLFFVGAGLVCIWGFSHRRQRPG
jgi:hypothetical protein